MQPDQIKAILRASFPVPDRHWVAALEGRLLPRRDTRRLVWATAAVALGLAQLVLLLSLAGPLVNGDDQSVRAREACRDVPVTRWRRTPLVREGTAGPEVVYLRRKVTRLERRC